MREPIHGYGIKNFNSSVQINNKTLYSTLRKFLTKGYVTKDRFEQEGHPEKYVYTITENGVEALSAMLSDFDKIKASSWQEFNARVLLNEFIPREALTNILNLRHEYLERVLFDNSVTSKDNQVYSDLDPDFSALFESHIRERTESEILYIDKLKKCLL